MRTTLATFNTFGGSLNIFTLGKRYKALAQHFNDSQTDVLQLQEVLTHYHLYLLQKLLHTYPYSFYEKSWMGPKGGLVTFSRFPGKKIRFVAYKRKFIPYIGKSAFELLLQRGALMVKISRFVFLNTHLTAVLNGNWNTDSAYFKELETEIDEFHKILQKNRTGQTVVASGDFNIAKGSTLFTKLIKLKKLTDPFREDNTPTHVPNMLHNYQKPERVDYIFLYQHSQFICHNKRSLLIREEECLDDNNPCISDHMGLEISLKRRRKTA